MSWVTWGVVPGRGLVGIPELKKVLRTREILTVAFGLPLCILRSIAR